LQNLGIAGKLEAVLNIFEQVYQLGKNVDALDQALLQSLFGTVQCTLMVGHNKYKDKKPVVEFLDMVGRVVLPGSSQQVDGDGMERVLASLVVICCEVVRWCNVFVAEGLIHECSRRLASD